MLSLLTPKTCLNKLQELNIDNIKKEGIEGIIFDLDNTLLPWDAQSLPSEVFSFLKLLTMQGFKVCIVSNNNRTRVTQLSKALEIPAISKATKPRRKSFRRAMHIMGTNCCNTAVIGDQIFTDVLGGNRLGLYTVLISPLNPKEFIGTRIVRRIERVVLKRLKRKGII